MLGRTGVLRDSSGGLNTRSWCFLLIGSRETRELVLEKPGSWCFLLVGAGETRELVLEKPGSWCFLLVGARENRELVLSASCSLQNKGCSLIMSWCLYV